MSKTPAALLDSVIEAVYGVLRRARPDEIDNLVWKSPLSEQIGNAARAALPYISVDNDARYADLLLAASNACPSNSGVHLDSALAIAAHAIYQRALNIEHTGPTDILARFDILLVYIREAWISDNEDLIWFVSHLRRQFAAFISTSTSTGPTHPFPPVDGKHRTILELVTGEPAI